MMRKWDLFFTALLVPLDYLALLLAGIAAYYLRFSAYFAAYRPVIFNLTFERYLPVVAFVAVLWLFVFALIGLYAIEPHRKKIDELKHLLLACTASFGGVLALVVFSRELFESRFILFASWVFAIFFVGMLRLFVRALRNTLYRAGVGLKRVAVIGSGSSAEAIVDVLKHHHKYGFSVVYSANRFATDTIEKLQQLASHKKIDQIIAITQNGSVRDLQQVLEIADEYHIPFRYSADFVTTTYGAGLIFDTLAGVPLVELRRTRLEGWGRIYKRMFDVVAAFILLIITSPIMLLAAFVLLLESGSPVLYRNERAGEHGQLFDTLKFRSMYQKYCIGRQFKNQKAALSYEEKLIEEQNEKDGPVYKIKNDPRITPVGRILRKTSIDELPQLLNVLKGDMSLVGPRPHQPREVEKYEKHHKRVLEIKPGMTGLPQISGRSDLSFEEEVQLDTYYIEHWSLKIDLVILLKTPFAVVGQKGTY